MFVCLLASNKFGLGSRGTVTVHGTVFHKPLALLFVRNFCRTVGLDLSVTASGLANASLAHAFIGAQSLIPRFRTLLPCLRRVGVSIL
jgi:hypothetical protein